MTEDGLIRVWRFALLLIPYALIYSIQFSNALILCLLFISILLFFKSKSRTFNWRDFLSLATPFWITLVGLSYSSNIKVGASILETRLPLLLFPIIFCIKRPEAKDRIAFLKHYLLSLLVTFFVVLIVAIYRNYKDPWSDVWFNQWYYHYDNLTEPIDIQPLYLSLFVGLGFLILLMEQLGITQFDFFNSKRSRSISIGIFSIFLVLLGVRSIIIILIFLIFLLLLYNKGYAKRKNAIITIVIAGGLIGLSFLSPVTRERFSGLVTQKFKFSPYSVDRFVIWSVALNHIRTNPSRYIFGDGTGTSEQLMDCLYKEEGIKWDFEKKTNTHNQYIGFILDNGFVGCFILISFLLISAIAFIKKSDWIGLTFILLMALSLVSENYLNRQKGVVFFSLFCSLLYLTRKEPKNFKSHHDHE